MRLIRWVFLLCAQGLCLAANSAAPRPDILFIMPDQMRGDCLSILDHPVIRTPHLDDLARHGILFRRAYSTCPSCIPARHSLLTGLYPATSGVVGFAGQPITRPTLPGQLSKAGYVTVLAGRNMHQVPNGDPYGYEQQILGSTYVANDEYDKFLKQAAPQTGGILKLVKDLGVSNNGWVGKPWPIAEDLHPTAWIIRQASRVVKETPLDKPLFLTASFFTPHPPLFPPKRFFDAFYQGKLPAVAHGDWVDWQALSTQGDKQGHRVLLQGDVLRATQAGYFGLIEHLDEQLAPLITAFKERSRKAGRPWLILLTSDHGEMLGDHGFFRKCEPFEGSANIPFVIAGSPDLQFKEGLRSSQPVCLEDMMPTLLALAGGDCPQPMDGINLVPVLQGRKTAIRDWLHFEHAPTYSKEQSFHALTDGRMKYIWRPLDGTEYLFDLQQDPKEERNLAKIPADRAQLELWRGRLIQRLKGRPEGFTDGSRLIPGRPYLPLQSRLKAKE